MASCKDINTISTFLADYHADTSVTNLLDTTNKYDCIVFCISAILPQAVSLFSVLQSNPDLTSTLVLCGGIGHSTPYLYDAVRRHHEFSTLAAEIDGLAESEVMNLILKRCLPKLKDTNSNLKILIENQSSNCGANATFTRKLLEKHQLPQPHRVCIVQDPTMCRRTVASFEKAYEDVVPKPSFVSAPLFVPLVIAPKPVFQWNPAAEMMTGIDTSQLWDGERFLDLIIGEIPRLRDDENGYGPNGKSFIAHVDIPQDVEEAWGKVSKDVTSRRG